MRSIQDELIEILEKEGLTPYAVAKAIGIDHASLYKSLTEGANPEWNTIKKILDHLGYDFRIIPRKKGKMMPRATQSFEVMNERIHKNLQKLFKSRSGEEITASQVKKVYREEFSDPDVKWVQASDHIKNPKKIENWHCSCVGTDKAIFERIGHGRYRVSQP